ncbi:MAG TPA: VCBS repeat-containing protein [Nannocystis sp.]|jgi:hypothetical protein
MAGVCADGEPSPGEFCFDFHDTPEVIAPILVSGARFATELPPAIAVFSAGNTATLVRWDNDQTEVTPLIPKISPASYVRALPVDVQDSEEPELVISHLWGASLSPNLAGELQALVPVGFPEEAFGLPGLSVPVDLDGDKKPEYIKGAGKKLELWRKPLDTWVKDPSFGFEVPGCKFLADFALGDFNDDGFADLAYIGAADADGDADCASASAQGIAILLRTEPGGFVAAPAISTGAHAYRNVKAGDFDADGRDDIASLGSNDELLLFRSTGDGEFASPLILGGVLSFVVGNLDGDSASECLLNRKGQGVVIIDRIFAATTEMPAPNLLGHPLAAIDLNHDGVDDIAFLWEGLEAPSLGIAISTP